MSALASPASNQPACPCCGGEISPLDLLLDQAKGVICYGGATARLTKSQFRMFRALAEAYPRTVTKDALLDALCDPANPDDGPERKIVDVIICKIRPMLDPLGIVIVTQWGAGYSIEIPDGEGARHLRMRRFDETRRAKHSPDDDDLVEVRRLRGLGYPLTDIARRAKLTYAAVGLAIDAIDIEDRAERARRAKARAA